MRNVHTYSKPIEYIFIFIATALFFIAAIAFSFHKLMWNDEWFTYYVSTLPSLAEIWVKMREGSGDTHPPLYHLAAHLALYSKLPLTLALRLPSMVGYWVMVMCVYNLVKNRLGKESALIAAYISLCQFYYAAEARPYGMLLGLTGISVLLWIQALKNSNRPVYAIALGCCLGATILTHFYGVLLLIPLGCAEIVLLWQNKKVSHWIFISIPFVIIALILVYPFAQYAASYRNFFWAKPKIVSSIYAYLFLFGLWTFLLLFFLGGYVVFLYSSNTQVFRVKEFSNAELVLFCSFALMPIWVHMLSYYTNGIYPRYAIAAVPGMAILCAIMLRIVELRNRKIYIFIASALVLSISCKIYTAIDDSFMSSSKLQIATNMLNAAALQKSHTIFGIHDSKKPDCIELFNTVKQELRNKIICIIDKANPSNERNLDGLAKIGVVPQRMPYNEFTRHGHIAPLDTQFPNIFVREDE